MGGPVSVVVRLGLVLVAVAVALWTAGSLRAVDRARAATELIGTQGRTSPSARAEGRTEFRQARAFYDDTELLVQEAGALLLIGRRGSATAPARQATEAEPENFVAWLALYRATIGRDPASARIAKRRALALDPSAAPLLARLSAGLRGRAP